MIVKNKKDMLIIRRVPLVEKTCLQCRQHFRGQRRAKYCGKNCSNRAAYWRNPEEYRASRTRSYRKKKKVGT